MRGFPWVRALIASLLFLAVGGYFLFNSAWFQKKYLYPLYYKETIYHYALDNEVDPFLVASIIKAESKFYPNAKSSKGATGLMQLMPETAAWIAQQIELDDFDVDALKDPNLNIRLGTWYLSSLQKEFEENEVLMLAAYNGGRGNVKQWMRQYGWTMEFTDVNQIPFLETRNYVKKVLRDKQRYIELYGR